MTTVPNFALYGHEAQPSWLDMVHVERIPVRSSLFNWEIEPHVHDALLQLLYVVAGGGEVFIDELKWPVRAVFRIEARVQVSMSRQARAARRWHST